ncbi:MAG: OmpH family outer membrane protein [Rikenellaceae bacterium]
MKKILFVAILSAFALTASAQNTKMGRVNASEIIMLMPETETAQKEIDNYQKELNTQIATMRDEYGKKAREYQEKSASSTALIRQQMEKDIYDLQTKIENFTQAAQADTQDAFERLMSPIRTKVLEAVTKIAKANSITAVVDSSQPPFIYMDETVIFDMTPAVKKVLQLEGRKLPEAPATPATPAK